MALTDDDLSSDCRPRRIGLPRSRSLPQLSHHDSGLGSYYGGSGADEPPISRTARLVADLRQILTLKQHYYPEGGWGWVVLWAAVFVHILGHGFVMSVGWLQLEIVRKFGPEVTKQTGWLTALSTGVSLIISPITISFCKKKSTRVSAVMGGLITALGCLFTSFATQFHQLYFSYGFVLGVGAGITKDCSTLMVAQYFKRRRELVEIATVSGSGMGLAVMSTIVKIAINAFGWRLGLQTVTGIVSLTFILGIFYRSASLYHPQRRAIIHIKNQKRKIKDKSKLEDKSPFFDLSPLRSNTVRVLLISTAIGAFGINTPLFYLAYQAKIEGLGDSTIFLQIYLGLAWTLGCIVFSIFVLHTSTECRISRQYLCQAAMLLTGVSILAFTVVTGNYQAYVMFAWIYGICCGGYHYSLKMYTYEKVRARNFAKTWGFVQFSQAIPIIIGVPFSGFLNDTYNNKTGYYFSSTCVLVGSLTLFLVDVRQRKLNRAKNSRTNGGTQHFCVHGAYSSHNRRLSFPQEMDNDQVVSPSVTAAAVILGADMVQNNSGGMIENGNGEKADLTCISEEGIADMDLPDNILDDLDYIGDCITSCNKVENYLMLSEFENNLIAEMPLTIDKKSRRLSLQKPRLSTCATELREDEISILKNLENRHSKWKDFPSRVITVIGESSV
ncbi:monocarboxylate transporter 12-like isoform X2 [Sitophilus oryzae]|uniref:Monocarboxylate transporter 12-like isoform X2 n=1 Tax=Sitophilus oryzae TaxID=7048 RepID=A0A6J2XP81_SITOR|nr:monocarboxylate transporter 12-like isoform X2 [Sitophilus oryzae]